MLFCTSHKSAPYVKHRRLDNPGKIIYQRIDWMDADFNASMQLIVKKGQGYADKMTGVVWHSSPERSLLFHDILIKNYYFFFNETNAWINYSQ